MRRYHHIGIPTNESKLGETHLKDLKVFVVSHQKSEFGMEWMRFEADAAVPDLVRRVPHVAHPTVSASHSSSKTARPSNCSNLPIPNTQPVYRSKWNE
jgi:hypothetical protein